MRLRGRFTLWFSLAALVPVAAAAVGTQALLSRNYRDEFARRRSAVETQLRAELERREREVQKKVAQLATESDPYVGGLLVELDKSGGVLRSDVQKRIREGARNAMSQGALTVFMLVDGEDVVLVSPHLVPLQDETDDSRAERARVRKGAPFFALEDVFFDNAPAARLVVESVQTASYRSQHITVVGGMAVDSGLLDVVRQAGSIDARIVSADGVELTPASEKWASGHSSLIRIPLLGADEAPIAWVELSLSSADVERNLRELKALAVVLGLASLLAMIILGLVVSRGITRDLDTLVEGVQAAARGNLDHEVPVRKKDEVGAVAGAFNLMMLDLKEAKERLAMAERVAAWQEIARRLAHEIKNPLTPIQMAVETIRRAHAKKHGSFDEIFEESTATVLEEAARLKRIVSEFSEFARMPKPQKRPVDMNELVTAATALYAGSVDVVRRLAASVPEISGDRDTLQQVILNLIENARDAIAQRPDGGKAGRIVVETRPTRGGSGVALIISDNGPGFQQGVKDKLFTPYFTTKHGQGGTGLGLAIVHRIVSDHGGKIIASETDEGGARFVVELPGPDACPDDLLLSSSGLDLPTAK